MVYLRLEKLPGLKQYKYAGVDNSLTSKYILKPFYTHVVIKCFPMWMAPNLITLIGFSFVVINFLTLLWYNPTLDQDCPPWVYISWAVGLFLYQTFDAVDGTQARRTHQSGPLGELFDHGVDACNTTLEVLLFAGAMNLGQSWYTVLTLFGALFTFYVQTWDEYFTQTLTLGVISGPVEGILTLCVVFALTAVKGGARFWHTPMLPTIGIGKQSWMPEVLYELPWYQWYMVYGGIVLVFNTLLSIQNVVAARRAAEKSVRIALLGLTPILGAWILIPMYLFLQPVILHNHLIPFTFYVGLVNAFSVGQIIIAHLIKSPRFPFGRHQLLVLPLAYAVVDSAGPFLASHLPGSLGWPSALGDGVYQVAFVFCCLGYAVGVYGSFVVDVIVDICDYMDIWCLTIKHPYEEGARKEQ
ncbi:MAG: hypothetical protein M1814_005205 [Vezdaea aestivalis]|nr:MAG: hypothetical protein M1814_005205 [Vezdaea aestivalis]